MILPAQYRLDAVTYQIPRWKNWLSIVVFICSALYGCFLWFSYQEAWIHPEQIRAAVYIWTPDTDSIWKLLRKAFDWAALDTADPTHWQSQTPAQRVRPLSDIAQVIDAIARPAITWILYPHPSLTPSALLAAILAPFFLFQFAKLTFQRTVHPWILVALWISSTGFLSIIVPDIHAAAKRLSILFLCLSLYLAARHSVDNKAKTFWILAATIFLSLFTDEMALGAYVALCCMFARTFLRPGARWKATAILAITVMFVIATNWDFRHFMPP